MRLNARYLKAAEKAKEDAPSAQVADEVKKDLQYSCLALILSFVLKA